MQLQFVALALFSLALSAQATSECKPCKDKTPPCIPEGGSKSSTCKSLSSGGVANINLFGCSSGDFSPVINLKRRHLGDTEEIEMLEERGHSKHKSKPKPKPKMCCWGPTQAEQTTYCKSASEAGLINLNVLGCSSNDFSPVVNVPSLNL